MQIGPSRQTSSHHIVRLPARQADGGRKADVRCTCGHSGVVISEQCSQ